MCKNTENNAEFCCGTISMDIELQAEETKTFYIVVGITDDCKKIKNIIDGAVKEADCDFT